MPPTVEQVRCRCNLPMVPTPGGGGRYCENCDTVQPQEALRGAMRVTTREDIRYKMYWVKQEAEYEDNTKTEEDADG